MYGVNGHTCDVDPNRIHELIEECRTAAPPLVDGDTPGSDMEGEKFDQVSCLHVYIPVRCVKEWHKVTV